MAAGPLSGVRVVDLTQLFPGPLATCILADLGAEVWKIEPPEGDPVRGVAPQVDGAGIHFHQLNRGKKSVCLNLKETAGRDAALRLVAVSDVLVESYRPGVLERLGLGRAALERVRPGLVVVSVSGWGAGDGRAGHDLNYQAAAGALGGAAAAGGDPHPPAVGTRQPAMPPALWGDVLGGLVGAICALAGLLGQRGGGRESRGAVAAWDVAIVDALLYAQQLQAVALMHAGGGAGAPAGAAGWPGLPFGGDFAWYNLYPTADGRWVSVAALEPKFWRALVTWVGHPEWAGRQFDPAAQPEMIAGLRAWFRSRPYAEWHRAAAEVDACLEPVARLDEVLASPRAAARGMTGHGRVGFPAVALEGGADADRAPGGRPPRLGPRLGEHTAEALALAAAGAAPAAGERRGEG